MACSFSYVRVYPQRKDQTLITWELDEDYAGPTPYSFTVEISRSGNPDGDDWAAVASTSDSSKIVFSVPDAVQRAWSTGENWFYRVRLDLPTSGEDPIYSYVEPAWGSLSRPDLAKMSAIYRNELLRLRKRAGSKGLLFKRKHWGEQAAEGTVIDQITGEVIDTHDDTDLGTGFLGGYWEPFDYWIGIEKHTPETYDQTELGTFHPAKIRARAVAWPLPRSRDVWIDCTSGKRYEVQDVRIVAFVRHVPVILDIGLEELPPTTKQWDIPVEYASSSGTIGAGPSISSPVFCESVMDCVNTGMLDTNSITWTYADHELSAIIDLGNSSIDDLFDVDITGTPSNGEVLTWTTGTGWNALSASLTGLPAGGSTDEVLTKQSATDYDADWQAVDVPTFSKDFSLETPSDSEDFKVFQTRTAVTIERVVGVLLGSATPTVDFELRHALDRSAAGTQILSGTLNSTTTGNVFTSFDDATIPADSYVWLITTDTSGTVNRMEMTVFGSGVL